MQRKFELEAVVDSDVSDVVRFDSLERAQQEPWGAEHAYRIITEVEIPDQPLMEPLVLNVWVQPNRDSEWKLLS